MIALFGLTLRQILRDSKLLLAIAVLLGPSLIAIVLRNVDADLYANRQDLWRAYHTIFLFLYLMVCVPLVSILFGPTLIATEAEAGTAVYLLTRLRRSTILLVRYAATTLVLAVAVMVCLTAFHFSLLGGVDREILKDANDLSQPLVTLRYYLILGSIGTAAFLAIVSMISVATAKSLVIACFYVIAEIILCNLPIPARQYTIQHLLRQYLTAGLKGVRKVFELPRELEQSLYPLGTHHLWIVGVVVAVALLLTCLLVSTRELTPSKVGKD